MFELNGKQYTLEQIEQAAKESNLSVEEYIQKAGLTEVGKQKPATQAATVGGTTNTGSQLESGSSVQSGTSGSTLNLDQVANLSEREVYETINELNKSKL